LQVLFLLLFFGGGSLAPGDVPAAKEQLLWLPRLVAQDAADRLEPQVAAVGTATAVFHLGSVGTAAEKIGKSGHNPRSILRVDKIQHVLADKFVRGKA